jgi:hypothetical protein
LVQYFLGRAFGAKVAVLHCTCTTHQKKSLILYSDLPTIYPWPIMRKRPSLWIVNNIIVLHYYRICNSDRSVGAFHFDIIRISVLHC